MICVLSYSLQADIESMVTGSEVASTAITKGTTAASATTATSATKWSHPGMTSTQQQDDTQLSNHKSTAKPVEKFTSPLYCNKSFLDHSISYVVNHKRFCKRYKLISGYDADSLQEHVEQVC